MDFSAKRRPRERRYVASRLSSTTLQYLTKICISPGTQGGQIRARDMAHLTALDHTHPASASPSFIFCVPSPCLSPSPPLHPHGTSCGQRPSGWRESQPTGELTLRPSLPRNAVQTVLCVASSVGAVAPLRLLSQAHDVSLEISRHRR